MNIAAVVATYNRKDLLRECLQALSNQTRPLDEIIVIDNASTDGTDRALPAEFPLVTYVRLSDNIGGAGGFHEGMKLAHEKGYDWVLVMDDDSVAPEDALEQLLDIKLLKDKRTYALASAVLNPDGSISAIHRRRFDPEKVVERPIDLRCYEKDSFHADTASFVGMLISRRAISEVGLPVKDFFVYYDDTEYSLRIREHGGAIVVLPRSRIVHKTRGENKQMRDRHAPLSWRTFYGRRNMLYTYRKYGNSNIGFYFRIIGDTFKRQARIILSRRHKLASTKILWMSTIDGLSGKLGKTIEPQGKEPSCG